MSINKVMITGNMTRDPELRQTPSGTAVLNFGIAVNDRRRNQQTGEWEEYPNFIDCTMFGRRAEGIAQYLSKGTKLAIEGRLHYSTWEDRNTGQKRSKVDVTVDEIEFLSPRNSGGGYGGSSQGGGHSVAPAPQSTSAPAAASTPAPAAPAAYDDEDIPF